MTEKAQQFYIETTRLGKKSSVQGFYSKCMSVKVGDGRVTVRSVPPRWRTSGTDCCRHSEERPWTAL